LRFAVHRTAVVTDIGPERKGEITVHALMPNPRRSAGRLLPVCVLIVSLVLAGCGSVQLVSSYDPAIDDGLTKYYESMNVFLSQMARLSAGGSAEGSYSANVKFYEESGAQIDSLIMRARAAEPKANCIGSDAVGVLARKLIELKPFATGAESLKIEEIVKGLQTGGDGSCTVQVLKVVRANHDLTAAIHKENDKLTPPVVAIIRPTIEQGVRIGVTTELAKKRGEK
jgi:hypothetical protein